MTQGCVMKSTVAECAGTKAKIIIQFATLVLSLGVFSACSQSKNSASVMSTQNTPACEQQTIAHRYIVQWEDGSFSVEDGKSDEDFRKNFVDKKLHLIKSVDRDYRIQLKMQELTQKNLSAQANYPAVLNWGPEKIHATELWSQNYLGQNVKVGIVDGMVDASHQQLSANVLSAQQFNDEVNDPIRNKHGTHVAGIIAADSTNGPVKGVAPKAKILGGQFIANDGSGSIGDAILAMNEVAKQGARIINMSWGGAPCVSNLKNAFDKLSAQDILLVTASGNSGMNLDYNPSYPATINASLQLNVAATTMDDLMAFFSNRGFRMVSLGAPGVGIISTIPGNKLEAMDGTSMAAPIVSGLAALLMGAEPTASAAQVKSAILRSVDVGTYELQVSSRGRVNAKKALEQLRLILSTN